MIRFDNVTKRYAGGRDALREITLTINDGEFVFLTGRSGAGKSTLIKLITLIERPTRGQVLVDGTNVGRTPRRGVPRHRRDIGMVFQDHKLLSDRSVFDNVALPLVIAGMPRREREKRVRAALDQVALLERDQSMPEALSTGERQRVGIARAVVRKPKLLIADEPTGNLDPELSADIMGIFLRFNAVGVTTLIASHDIPLIERMGRRVLTLHDGQLVGDQEASVHG
ncbi:MAG: cell division ATP-binding protein FtsE [Pseudomonadota bacterium]